jgi:hypothetical protein
VIVAHHDPMQNMRPNTRRIHLAIERAISQEGGLVMAKAKEDRAVLEEFASKYKGGVVVLRRSKPRAASTRKVNVYVDGLLTVMDEDLLQRLIDIGFYVPVPA